MPLSLQEIKATIKTDKTIKIIFLLFMYELLNMNFVFITKQGFFIFIDKLSKLIEVKKYLTKLCNKNEALKNLNAFKN